MRAPEIVVLIEAVKDVPADAVGCRIAHVGGIERLNLGAKPLVEHDFVGL